jgi:aspartate ammonia-lyase
MIKIAKKGLIFFLGIWISTSYAQVSNSGKKTNTTADKEKLLAIEKACQKIINEKEKNHFSNNSSDSLSSSDINLIKVFGNISSELQNDKNTKQETNESKNQLNAVQTFNDIYPKEKYEALIAHGNNLIKKTEFLSQTLHKKGDELEATFKMQKSDEQNKVIQKMGEAFHVMGFRIDSVIMDLRKTQPYIVEAYTNAMAIGDEATPTENLKSSLNVTKSLYGIVLYLSAIKNCNATVSKIQDDLAFLSNVSRTKKQ